MKIYLDYAASTPVDPRVERMMRPYFLEKFGNPGSLHSFGQEGIAAVDLSRERIALLLGADFREIIFTGSATEANNLAIRGAVRRFWWEFFQKHNRSTTPGSVLPHIISSAIEHESVLETLRDVERRGAARVTIVPVDRNGAVSVATVERVLTAETILVSVMYANNEIGTIQSITEIGRLIRAFRLEKDTFSTRFARSSGEFASSSPLGRRLPAQAGKKTADQAQAAAGVSEVSFSNSYPLFHTDASQAFQFLDCNIQKLGVDLMTFSAHKIYGPKGVGALYIKQGTPLDSLTTGGGQEFGIRSGTENVPLIVGFAKAAELIQKNKEREAKRLRELSEYFLEGLKKIYPKIELNGPREKGERLPNILNIYFPDYEAEDLLLKFDLNGLAVSAGSACRARSVGPSYVLQALGLSKDRITKSIRMSFGRPTTKAEIDKALRIIKIVLK